MSLQENKALVRRFVEEMQNAHELDALDTFFSSDFVDHSGLSDPPTLEGSRGLFTMMFAAFPNMHFTIAQQIAEGDQVVTLKTFHGTHEGTFMGIPATGKQVEIDNIDIFTVRDGKLSEHWAVGDFLGMLQQLGAVPAPG
jgi:steroid delta-isomerase-like uncharacterized protein